MKRIKLWEAYMGVMFFFIGLSSLITGEMYNRGVPVLYPPLAVAQAERRELWRRGMMRAGRNPELRAHLKSDSMTTQEAAARRERH